MNNRIEWADCECEKQSVDKSVVVMLSMPIIRSTFRQPAESVLYANWFGAPGNIIWDNICRSSHTQRDTWNREIQMDSTTGGCSHLLFSIINNKFLFSALQSVTKVAERESLDPIPLYKDTHTNQAKSSLTHLFSESAPHPSSKSFGH